MKSEIVDDEDFLIQVSPKLDSEDHWTGQVEVNIMSSDTSCLDPVERDALLFFCQMICAAVPIYEEHVQIREMAACLGKEKYSDEDKEKLNGDDPAERILANKDNVIHIDFRPKKEH